MSWVLVWFKGGVVMTAAATRTVVLLGLEKGLWTPAPKPRDQSMTTLPILLLLLLPAPTAPCPCP